MTEPDVALTDFAITVECCVFAYACARRAGSRLRGALVALFVATAVASAIGGVVHAFASDPASLAYRVLWPLTLLAIIGAATALTLAALDLLEADPRWRRAAWIAGLAFGTGVVAGRQSFALAVAAYVPASLLLAYAFAVRFRRVRAIPAAPGSFGMLLAIFAGGLQQAGYTPLPGLLSHNAFYHLLQMVALALLFVAGRDALPIKPAFGTLAPPTDVSAQHLE